MTGLRIGLISTGHWHTDMHLQAFRAVGTPIEVLHSASTAESPLSGAGPVRRVPMLEALMAEQLDLVLVLGSPTEMLRHARTLLERGIAVGIEKPVGVSGSELADLAALARSRSLLVSVAQPHLRGEAWSAFGPNDGPISHFRFRLINGSPQRYLDLGVPWVLDPQLAGGGALRNLGLHGVSAFHQLTGSLAQVYVCLLSNRLYGLESEEYAAVQLLSGGVIGQIEVGYTLGSDDASEFEMTVHRRGRSVRDDGRTITVLDRCSGQKTVTPCLPLERRYEHYARDPGRPERRPHWSPHPRPASGGHERDRPVLRGRALDRPVRVGIIGAGWWAARHAEALAQLPGFSVVGVSSANLSSAQAFSDRVGARAFSSHHALLKAAEVDAVLVAAPHRLHAELALDVLAAGVPLLLEKPTATTREDARRVTSAVNQSRVPCLVGLTSHYFPGFRAAKALLDSGKLGRPLMGQSTFQKLWMEENRQPWHLDRDQGGGMLLTAGIHAVDRLLWLMNARVTAVSAVIGTYHHLQQADDLASLFLRLEGAVVAQVNSLGYAAGGPVNRTELICERGALRVTAGSLEIGEEDRWRPVPLELPADPVLDALGREWLDLADLVAGDHTPLVTTAFAAELMEVLFLAEDSAREGRELLIS